jgi:hypothetical protein
MHCLWWLCEKVNAKIFLKTKNKATPTYVCLLEKNQKYILRQKNKAFVNASQKYILKIKPRPTFDPRPSSS